MKHQSAIANWNVGDSTKREPPAMTTLREASKHRRRRLIYNNDGCDIMEESTDTPEGFLSKRFQPILNTQCGQHILLHWRYDDVQPSRKGWRNLW